MSVEKRRRAAASLIRRGAAVIPVPAGEKNPGRPGWEALRITEEEIPHYWTNGQNVGVLCGGPSGWRVDIDLDADEAVKIAFRFLPATLTSGRKSRPHSHCWYVAPGAESADWKDTDGKKLVELRSTGRQTLVAPSTHPDGDEYLWHSEAGLKMAGVSAAELRERCRELATAALIARHVPPEGSRHDYAMALSGLVLRDGRMETGLALKFLKAAWHAAGADSQEALRDLEGIVSDTAENLDAGERVVGGPTLEEYAPGMVRLLCKWWGWSKQDPQPEHIQEKQERPTQAQLLVRCATGAEFFHTPAGETYATIPVGDRRETHLVKSRGLRRWLVRGYYEQYDRPPGAQALQDALGLLEARAQFDGPEREVYVRVAGYAGAIYVDLANERWEAVEITASGWRVVSDPPVRFRRPRGMLPLPRPTERGDSRDGLDGLLQEFINVTDKNALRLIVAWMVQAFRPSGPYPVLLFQGEQGSAKSTAERLVRAVVDPSTAPLRTTPRNERDLVIAATNSWCVAFDNISALPHWCSDALCRLSTGGGFSARELYTDAEEVLFDATRPIALNGITDVATRPDLLDRALIVPLPPIPEERRRPEAELWREFEETRPAVLAALFDAVSGALATVESVRLEGMPRMADFAVWATAAERALGWESGAFMTAYAGNRAEAAESALEADPVAVAVRSFMEDREEWSGTAGDLWEALNEVVGEGIKHTKAWPGAPNALSGRLKRLAPALRGIGIDYGDVRLPGGDRKRAKRLRKNKDAKDRPYRPDRPAEGESPANTGNDAGTISQSPGRSRDDVCEKTVPGESPANKQVRDDRDDEDDDLQPEPDVWENDPMRHYGKGA